MLCRCAALATATLVVTACGPSDRTSARPEPTPGPPPPRLGKLEPSLDADESDARWPGYPPSVLAQFDHAREVLGDELDGWTLGSLAPALYDWVGPDEERTVWTLIGDDPCEPAVIRRPEGAPSSELETFLLTKFRVEESVEAGVRVRHSKGGRLGHEMSFGNGASTERFEDGAWVEARGHGVGEPPPTWGTLSSIDERVARFEAPEGRPAVECHSPTLVRCAGGGARLCPSCARLRIKTIYLSRATGSGVGFGGPSCADPCPPRGPDHPELAPLQELLSRYGGFRDPEGEPGALVFRHEADCRAAQARRARAPTPHEGSTSTMSPGTDQISWSSGSSNGSGTTPSVAKM